MKKGDFSCICYINNCLDLTFLKSERYEFEKDFRLGFRD